MKKENKKLQPKIKLVMDKQVIPANKNCTRILEVSITAPLIENKGPKPPLNLSVVIDRSGSMSGDKLHFAKQAAAHLVDLLSANDRAAVVMYDSEIDVVSPSIEMTADNKVFIKSAIQRIASRGSTNLFGGWLKGSELVAEAEGKSSLNRTLLLSDGLANQGITNLDEIATHTRELSSRGVSTSCFGIGLHYNEHLLEAMANAGGGNFHFLEALSTIPIAFEREFEQLINQSLRDVSIKLELPEGMACTVSGGWPAVQNGNVFTVSAGNLFSEQEQKLYFQVQIPSISSAKSLSIPVKITADASDGAKVEMQEVLKFDMVDSAAEQEIESDPELMARFALVDMADKATEALKYARAGDRAGASEILGQSIRRHTHNISAETRGKHEYMINEINHGMDEMSFKRHHQESYNIKKTRMNVRDYSLREINGHLFTRIERQLILIDTGIPISLGSSPEWYFMDMVHPLSREYMGVSLDQISRLVDKPIDMMMGADIIKKYCVFFEMEQQRVTFSTRPLFRSKYQYPLTLFMGVPGVRIDVMGSPGDAFLDTGAKLSYITADLAEKLEPKGVEKDFYPGLGEFETKVYDVDFSLGDQAFTLRCGVLPSLLGSTLLVAGKKAILGVDFLRNFAVQLDFRKKIITLRP